MNRTLKFTIDKLNDGLTIEKYLRNFGFSSGNITALKKMPNNALLNGTWEHLNAILHENDILTINIQESNNSEKIPPVDLPLNIIYEDEDIIVVNKPANMPIHPSLNNYENSLANALAFYFEQQDKPFIFRCTNRLDKNTSGLTVISKNMLAANILSTMVKNREFKREYYCIVRGKITPSEGTIDAPIARLDQSIITRYVDFAKGERAITHYKALDFKNGHSLVSVHLETGRTHQIRVHFKYIGFPLVGDYLYNPDFEYINRQALHSHKISFTHPITKEFMEFTAPLPEDMDYTKWGRG